MSKQIRTLGLYQPYAALMLHGKIESRWVAAGKKPPFPLGEYLIYSTKKAYSDKEFRHLSGGAYRHAMELLKDEAYTHYNGFGLMLATLVEVKPLVTIMESRAFIDTDMREWESGGDNQIIIDGHALWALEFENVRRIKPLAFKGKQGVGFVPEELIPKIEVVE